MARILRCCGCGVGWAATAPIRPLAWEPPHAAGAALEKTKKKKKKKRRDTTAELYARNLQKNSLVGHEGSTESLALAKLELAGAPHADLHPLEIYGRGAGGPQIPSSIYVSVSMKCKFAYLQV